MKLTRRDFVRTAAITGAGMALAPPAWAETPEGGGPATGPKPPDLNVAIIGAGSQGRNLVLNCLKISGIRFKAVCDIWPYHQKYAANVLKKYDQAVTIYADYHEMLA